MWKKTKQKQEQSGLKPGICKGSNSYTKWKVCVHNAVCCMTILVTDMFAWNCYFFLLTLAVYSLLHLTWKCFVILGMITAVNRNTNQNVVCTDICGLKAWIKWWGETYKEECTHLYWVILFPEIPEIRLSKFGKNSRSMKCDQRFKTKQKV